MTPSTANRGGPSAIAIGLGVGFISFALPILGVPRSVAWIVFAVGCGLVIVGALWWYQGRGSAASRINEQPESRAPTLRDRLVSELKDGHLLDARLQNSGRRDKAWYELCDEIDDWTFEIQQLLYLGPTEFLTDFRGDWKPNPLQSRDNISAELQARLRELSVIVQKLKQ